MAYKFIRTIDSENKFSNCDVEFTVSSNSMTYPELLEVFEEFLRGCGYVFDGHVEIVEEE